MFLKATVSRDIRGWCQGLLVEEFGRRRIPTVALARVLGGGEGGKQKMVTEGNGRKPTMLGQELNSFAGRVAASWTTTVSPVEDWGRKRSHEAAVPPRLNVKLCTESRGNDDRMWINPGATGVHVGWCAGRAGASGNLRATMGWLLAETPKQ